MRRRTRVVPVLLLVLSTGCASASLRKTAILNAELAKGLSRVQTTVEQSYLAGEIQAPMYMAFQRGFLRIATVGVTLNQAIRESNEKGAYEQVAALVRAVDTLIEMEVFKLPEPARGRIMIALEALRSTLLVMSALLGGA